MVAAAAVWLRCDVSAVDVTAVDVSAVDVSAVYVTVVDVTAMPVIALTTTQSYILTNHHFNCHSQLLLLRISTPPQLPHYSFTTRSLLLHSTPSVLAMP